MAYSENSRKSGGTPTTDSLSLYPEVVSEDVLRTAGALLLIAQLTDAEPHETRPQLDGLYSALEARLQKAGGVDAVVPQNASDNICKCVDPQGQLSAF
jgi:type VI secretion system protein VasJ